MRRLCQLCLLSAMLLAAATVGSAWAAAAPADIRGVYLFDVCPGQVSGSCTVATITQTSTILTEDLKTGAVTGSGSDARHAWTLSGRVSGTTVELTATFTDVAAHTSLTATASANGDTISGTYSTTGGANSHGVMTGTRTSGPPSPPPGPTESAPSFVLCVPADCSGLSLSFPPALSPETPIMLSLNCGAEAARVRSHPRPVAVAAEGPACQQAAFLRNLTSMTKISVSPPPEPTSSYSSRQVREIKQALTDLSTTDPNPAVQSAARKLSNDPSLTPNAQTTGDVEALLQALGHAAESGEGDPGLLEVDESLAGGFTESSALETASASSVAGAQAALVSHPNTAATLAALIARRPSAADGRAFDQTIAIAAAPQATAARGAARLTLALGYALAVRLSSHAAHGRRSAPIGRAILRRPKHARTTITVNPSVEGQRLLRELEIIGLSQPVHVSVELSERVGRGRIHRSIRSIRVI